MEFTHWLQAAPPDIRDETWWRCPYCGHDGMTKESTMHLPRCPWPQLEADRLEIDSLRAENERLRELLIEAVFDGSAMTNDWKDRVHELLGRE